MARGSVVKKSNSYYIVYRLNGKQVWKSAGSNKRIADRMLTDTMNQIHNGGYQEIEDITFKDISYKWLYDYAKPRVKSSTYRFYKGNVEVHLLPYFGEFKLSSISTHMIEEFLAKKQKDSKLSPTTVGYLLTIMKMILKRAIVWDFLSKNPAEYIQKPKRQRKEMDFLNIEELQIFLETVEKTDPGYYPLFLAASLTGMRRGEITALKWSDVNWTTNQIHVRRSVVSGNLEEPKSKAAIRAIIVPPLLISVLKKYHLSCPIGELDLVFPNREGNIMHAENMVKRHFLPALRRSGLRRIRFHDLRHTYASLLIAQGENLKFIQQQLGHSSSQTTLDRYGHLMPQVQQGFGERLEEAVFGNSVRKVLEDSSFKRFENSHNEDNNRLACDKTGRASGI